MTLPTWTRDAGTMKRDIDEHGYCLVKEALTHRSSGIIALTKVWARELMEHNITVNSVSPFAMTPGSALNGKRWGESNAFKKSHPSPPKLYSKTGKGTPEEMAAAVAFFASDEASYITGQILSVNGGRFMF